MSSRPTFEFRNWPTTYYPVLWLEGTEALMNGNHADSIGQRGEGDRGTKSFIGRGQERKLCVFGALSSWSLSMGTVKAILAW